MPEQTTQPVITPELYGAILLGTQALQHMAFQVASAARDFEVISAVKGPDRMADEISERTRAALTGTLHQLIAAMNDLGDFCNNADLVDKVSERVTSPAFETIRDVLAQLEPTHHAD